MATAGAALTSPHIKSSSRDGTARIRIELKDLIKLLNDNHGIETNARILDYFRRDY